MKIISDSELKSVTTVIVIDDMFDTCGILASGPDFSVIFGDASLGDSLK